MSKHRKQDWSPVALDRASLFVLQKGRPCHFALEEISGQAEQGA
jgi:hypothetical protein